MLRKIRILLACLCFIGIALLFLDVSGLLSTRLAFLAKIQLVPALLAGSYITVAFLLTLTFVCGRVYCSAVCPLGIFQDAAARLGKRKRFRFASGKRNLRLAMLAIFIVAFIVGLPLVFGILEPYGAFGRILTGLFAPVWNAGNNALAYASEKTGILMIAHTPVWIKGLSAFILAALTFVVIGYLAIRGGRTWCNTICPAGTALGIVSRFSILRPRINPDSCSGCALCEKSCKSSCIDARTASIDSSRCVACFNCIEVCPNGSLNYSTTALKKKSEKAVHQPDMVRRGFLVAALGAFALPASIRADEPETVKEDEIPALTRKIRRIKDVPVVPPGAWGLRGYSAKCTGCQLCVSTCPNQVLVASDKGLGMLQPTLTFERGYCRVNCTDCSQVCPTGAIKPVTVEEKSSIQIGRAVVDRERCIRKSDNVECTTCIKNCPAGVITAIEKEDGTKDIAVDEEKCVGCGACEYFCPVRPTGAIIVVGTVEHRRI